MSPRIRLDTPSDTRRIIEAIHRIWLDGEPPDEEDAREVRDGFAYYYENFSEYTSGQIALAEVDDEIVSMAGIIPFPVASGSFTPQAAQLNPVGTRRKCREKGLASACIRLLCEHLREQGGSLFFVSGVPGFYPKLGFYPAFDRYQATLPVARLHELQTPTDVRPFSPRDAEPLLQLYERPPHQNLLHLRRDRHWIGKKILSTPSLPLGTIHRDDVLVAIREGLLTGYAFLEKSADSLALTELRARHRQDHLALLKTAAASASRRKIVEIQIDHAVPTEPLFPLALELGGRISTTCHRSKMLKILSVERLFTSMRKIFTERVTRSSWADKPFSLTIDSHGEQVVIENTGDGNLSIHPASGKRAPRPDDSTSGEEMNLAIPAPALVQLFAGHRTVCRLIDGDNCPDFGETANSLLQTLFPEHYPYVYETDLN